MKEIGEFLKSARINNGVSLEEAAEDLNLSVNQLENIEDGNIRAFKDVFVLKDYIRRYSKYLGLDSDDIIDMFNNFMFEKTSKIPMEKIEEAAKETLLEEEKDNRVASPYTKAVSKIKTTPYIIALTIVSILMVCALIWSIRQITIMNATEVIIFR